MDIEAIKQLLSAGNFLEAESDKQPFLSGWRGGWQGKSPLVCLPNSVEMLQKLVRHCHQNRIPMVPQGGNTGLTGGSVPDASNQALLISLSRLNKTRAINAEEMTITAEAGVILQQLQEHAADEDMLFPIAMASEGSCQIGGILSTNAGGTDVLRYGTTRQLCLGLEVVLPDGSLLPMLSDLRKDNTGYDIKQWFIGAEGTLGFITAASFRLFPAIKQRETMLLAATTAEQAAALFYAIRAQAGELLAGCELVHHNALQLVAAHQPDLTSPFTPLPAWAVLVELATASPHITLRNITEAILQQAFEANLASDGVLAENEQQRRNLWAWRENVSEAARAQGRGIHCDISVPVAQVSAFMATALPQIAKAAPTALPFPFGHMGDGNIHYNFLLPNTSREDEFTKIKHHINSITQDILVQFNGSISAEHGIGRERRDMLPQVKPASVIRMMQQLKNQLDPHSLMNPGVVL